MAQSQTLPLWLDKLGDWNPQLLREFKGRLNGRSVLLTVTLITIVQVLFMMNFIQQIPTEETVQFNARYCGIGWDATTWASCVVDWKRWYLDIFKSQNILIPYLIYLPAIYFLIADINQEIQRGTINFLRLSPRSSQNILLGKLLGVPCLTSLALLFVIPLHIWCGTMAGISPMFFFSYYSAFVLMGAILMMGALLLGFSHRTTGNKNTSTVVSSNILLGILTTGAIVLPIILIWNHIVLWVPYLDPDSTINQLNWFFLTVNRNPIVTHLFTFANLTIVTTFLWSILQRVFQNPTATLISKRQSYLLVLYLVLLTIGSQNINPQTNMPYGGNVEFSEYMIPWLFAGLTFALSTVRQTWFEWIRKVTRIQADGSSHIQPSRKDLIWGEKSPGLTAIVLNLLMVVGIIMTALIFRESGSKESSETYSDWLGLMLMAPLIINYALLVQWMLMLKTQKRSTWAIGSLLFAIGLPSIIGSGFLSFGNSSPIGAILLMCSPWFRAIVEPISRGYLGGIDMSSVMTALIIQVVLVIFLASRVWSEYRKMLRS